MGIYKLQAIEKLNNELKTFDIKKAGQHANAVKDAVANALLDFCRQDEEFAQAVVQNEKTLTDCCSIIMKNCGNAISDVDVYKKAVSFYFPGADVQMSLTIDLCASVKDSNGEAAKPAGEIINLSLTDLFD